MTWFGWVLIALLTFNVLVSVAQIGKPRSPIDPTTAIISLVLAALLIWGAVTVGTIA